MLVALGRKMMTSSKIIKPNLFPSLAAWIYAESYVDTVKAFISCSQPPSIPTSTLNSFLSLERHWSSKSRVGTTTIVGVFSKEIALIPMTVLPLPVGNTITPHLPFEIHASKACF